MSIEADPQYDQLTPAEREAKKSDIDRGKDVSYTVNHTLSCYLVDAVSQIWPYLDHKHDRESHGHHDHGTLGQFIIGEFLGDAAAIVPTLAFQRLAPGFMQGMANVMEPVVRPLFQWSAERNASAWARHEGLLPNSPEAKEKAQQLYRYEIDHLPQAVVWTALGAPMAAGMHKLVKVPGDYMPLVWGQYKGKLISSGLLVGARGFAPDKMHQFDVWTSKNIYTPVAKVFGGGSVEEQPVIDKALKDKQVPEIRQV